MDKRLAVFLVALFSVFAADYSEGNRKLAKQSILENDLQAEREGLPLKALTEVKESCSNKLEKATETSATTPRRYLHGQHTWSILRTTSADSASSPSPSLSPTPGGNIFAPSPSPTLMSLDKAADQSLSTSKEPSQTNKDVQKYLMITLILIIVLGLVVIAILLVLCVKSSKEGSKGGVRDEKPLLDFSSSDASTSPKKSRIIIDNSKSEAIEVASNTGSSLDANHDLPQVGPQTMEANYDLPQAGPQKMEATAESARNTKAALPIPPGKRTSPEAALPIPPGKKTSPPPPNPPPGPPPPLPPVKSPAAPAAPPPPKMGRHPPNPPQNGIPSAPEHHRRRSSLGGGSPGRSRPPKTKLKPLFWDKVLANPDHSMVWDNIRDGSFQFNEEMMETLFGYFAADMNKNEKKKDSPAFDNTPQYVQIIDPKKSQNLAILLKALNVTTEQVCDALKEGHELQPELVQTLLKMAPTTDEELKLKLYNGELSQLGPAERFLKALVDIPFAYKRLEVVLFFTTFDEEFPSLKESLSTLEVACNELTNSRLFLKLLEAVLKTGNRMNDGTYRGGATAFKLDTLLKLSDVKGVDGKTTLLHFVILEIVRSEGVRAARRLKERQSASSSSDSISSSGDDDSLQETEEYHRNLGLQVVSGLSHELEDVKKASIIDAQALTETVSNLNRTLAKTKEFVEKEMKSVKGCDDHFREAVTNAINEVGSDMEWLVAEEKRIMSLVRSTRDYFHGKSSKDDAPHLFVIVRDFLQMLDNACKDFSKTAKDKAPSSSSPSASPNGQDSDCSESSSDIRKQLFPLMREKQKDDGFSSDDEHN
ncbi:formin-like protein 3 [Andrographis paniculata]|uniref:formin-like protein 3 n=1 Tax=Andrographis paniculata TaxID=175694 RepID=UPI0021E93097|nr:formin-like protein 3 [Andrographis paniculata]